MQVGQTLFDSADILSGTFFCTKKFTENPKVMGINLLP